MKKVLRRLRHSFFASIAVLAVQVLRKRSLVPLRERRMRSVVARSGLFDVEWYLKSNPDVARSGVDPIRHYVAFGARELRDPSPMFSTQNYLLHNPDVASAGINPLGHFALHGAMERRLGGLALDECTLADRGNKRFAVPLRLWSVARDLNMLSRAIPRAIAYYGSLPTAIARTVIVLRRQGVQGIKLRAATLLKRSDVVFGPRQTCGHDLYGANCRADPSFSPKVSVIVPNFNHERYLKQRLESIYSQTYTNFEVILLDDCSKDGSLKILREFLDRFPEKTKCCFNKFNSGGVFNQWKRGFELATGGLVWIAESDDHCTPNFLEELVPFFANEAVTLAYCRSDFVRGTPPIRVWTTEDYLADLRLDCWQGRFIKSAHWLVNNAWTKKNIIANVSSAVFRNPGKLGLFDDPEWINLRLCGDWIFYLTVIRGGLVAYSPYATNFYRQHAGNISVNTQKEDTYYREHEVVAKKLVSLYRLDRGVLEEQKEHLYRHWVASRGSSSANEFDSLYDVQRIRRSSEIRKPNLLMAGYALVAGGGETFPIMLANMLKANGYGLTFLNCNQQKTEPDVRRMLNSTVPLLELSSLELVEVVFKDLGVEVIHSHHAWADVTLASLLRTTPQISHVVTLHGMYEMMSAHHLKGIMPILQSGIDRFVFSAEKHLTPFSEKFRSDERFVRIDNAVPTSKIKPIPREDFGIGQDDFVLCLVGRAIPEKGWEEGINAVVWANQNSKRPVHLLLVGNGPEFDRLQPQVNHLDFVHFLGFRANVKDYFASADIGFLPSRFLGESSPLVLIECLQAGRPMLASNIGEIGRMLQGKEGLAGELFDLQGWTISVQTVGALIVELAEDRERYQKLLNRVPDAVAKFDSLVMLESYEAVYQRCMPVP
jgi:glycosyltransferase involved in cell wall biosynthesis